MKPVWRTLKLAVTKWIGDQPFHLAAALSYYTLFSLAPLLVIVILIAGFAFGQEAAQNQIVETLGNLVGRESAEAIQGIVQNANIKLEAGLIATSLGVVVSLVGAGGVVGELQTSLNFVWGVEPKAGQGLWGFVRQRFVSFAMVLGIGFLLLVSLTVSTLVTALSRYIGGLFEATALVAGLFDFLVSLGFITVLFAMIYKFLPDATIQWRDVWIGAGLTAGLFTVGKILIGLYLGSSGVTSIYGAAGSVITILLWVYYSALIFFLGAEFTAVYAREYGSGIVPSPHAQPVAEAEQGKQARVVNQDRSPGGE